MWKRLMTGSVEISYGMCLNMEYEEYGVKGRLLRAIRSLYDKSEACVKVKDELSGWFLLSQGVR